MTEPDIPTIDQLLARPFFFVGIGGSGMQPLAQIVRARGAAVAGSDRAFDQGRSPEKFARLEREGFRLVPQDGSGIKSGEQVVVASAAIEDSVPEIARANELGCLRMTRAELNAILFNTAGAGIAVAGTSGKSTVTAMLGHILARAGREPTVMNGARMKDFDGRSAVAGSRAVYLSEVDESDGSIALYRPAVGLLLNVSLDHMPMPELRGLFGDYLERSRITVVNADDPEALALLPRAGQALTFGLDGSQAQIGVAQNSIASGPLKQAALVVDRHEGAEHALLLAMPGRHNLSNALAAMAGAAAAGVPVGYAVEALGSFTGIARRFDVIGEARAVTVIDDFGHNPEKIAATLRTLKAHPGRVIAFFQPHGFGPLKKMGRELAQVFAAELDEDDVAILCDPVYFGGTVDRSVGAAEVVRWIGEAGGQAEHVPDRETCGERIAALAEPGDRVAVMGARDDTLSDFAASILDRLKAAA